MPQFETEYEAKLYNDRLASLEKITALGTEKLGLATPAEAAFPNSFRFQPADITIAKIRAQFDATPAEVLEQTPPAFAIAGRLMAIRAQGKAGFAQLQQGGERLQIYVRKDDVGADFFDLYKLLHIGDHIGVRGTLMRTRTGELTLKAHPIAGPGGDKPLVFLAKATIALPDKYHGLEDIEQRYRQRYVDLIMNAGTAPQPQPAPDANTNTAPQPQPAPDADTDLSSRPEASQSEAAAERPAVPNDAAAPETPDTLPNVRATFLKRAAVLRAIRKFFDTRDYIEVETPMLHPVVGGAAARPFTTHHNALDIPLFLRIAPELYLKRLVVGGLDRVYEINRNFRNEGVSTRHNPEFTMLEFYQAYANYHDLMDLTEELIKFVAMEVNGSYITHFNGNEIDLSKWQKLSMREAIMKWWPEETVTTPTLADLSGFEAFLDFWQRSNDRALQHTAGARACHEIFVAATLALGRFDVPLQQQNYGRAIAAMFESLAEPHLIQPTIIYDFPLAVSPLSKVKPDEPDWVERFEFYIGGFEVGNAFSELNDAADQEARFQAQVADKQSGDEEAMGEVDEDYVRALGYGLPPTAGEGIGIDRLTMVLTGARSIRDVILFPLMRPHPKPGAPTPPTDEHTLGESVSIE